MASESPTEGENPSANVFHEDVNSEPLSVTSQSSAGVNPQDATRPEKRSASLDYTVTVHDDTPQAQQEEGAEEVTAVSPPSDDGPNLQRKKPKRRKRPHPVRLASVENHSHIGIPLPANQYECILYRRAIRKAEETTTLTATNKSADDDDNEEAGDVSLGLKLTVVSGKVIVQKLNALGDGRASPAQLAGIIKRGDVLLSINGTSLVNLPIDQLMKGLSPLSTPNPADGLYQRELRLRFSAGEGLGLLSRSRTEETRKQQLPDVDVFSSLFPMVDQLSGMPLFEHDHFVTTPTAKLTKPVEEVVEEEKSQDGAPEQGLIDMPLDEWISANVAKDLTHDREQFLSEFFAWNEELTELLRQPQTIKLAESQHLTLSQLIERGRRAIMGARALSDKVENVDQGRSDVRSLKSWNATLSLYSGKTANRRPRDAMSLPANILRVDEEDEEDESDGSTSASEEEPLDPDQLLLRLAAHDEVWRRKIMEYLAKVVAGSEEEENASPSKDEEEDTVDAAMSNELGNFLFGETATILRKRKRPQALPPDDITAILFDLATKISATIPNKISTTGSRQSSFSDVRLDSDVKKATPRDDIVQASQFLLEDSLPAWLKSFRPLPWDQRRVLWPLDKVSFGGSTACSTISDDSLTVDSAGQSRSSPSVRRRKNLRERVEEQVLNPETRNETCYLVTHYFTQRLLKLELGDCKEETHSNILTFIRTLGSYLNLHASLCQAAIVKAELEIDCLLELATHDLQYKEAMKHVGRSGGLIFYEPTMLAALTRKLYDIQTQDTFDGWLLTIDLCASAFPDIQPWQVQKVCLVDESPASENKKKALKDLYYIYLSQLLHPIDGHDVARHDGDLVKQWCELSVRGSDNGSFKDRALDRRGNFYSVASRTSSDHLLYSRDLVFLLKLCTELNDSDLALDIAAEILEDRKLAEDPEKVQLALAHLRVVSIDALDSSQKNRSLSAQRLKRVLRIFRTVEESPSSSVRDALKVDEELLRWMQHQLTNDRDPLDLIHFLANEAKPDDVLEALKLSSQTTDQVFDQKMAPVIHALLRRAAGHPRISELSGALVKLRCARLRLDRADNKAEEAHEKCGNRTPEPNIWKRMSTGIVSVVK